MTSILVISPHPDDETLGCGGTLLKHVSCADSIHWLIVTEMHVGQGFSSLDLSTRAKEIESVQKVYGFSSVTHLGFPTTGLDQIGLSDLVQSVSEVITKISPTLLYLPFGGDAHSDHRIVFDSVVSSAKWFRQPSIRKILAYETLSETDIVSRLTDEPFKPNVFVEVTDFLQTKIDIMELYKSEFGQFPFPRSEQAIRSLAAYRGTQSGCRAAEAFMLVKEIIK